MPGEAMQCPKCGSILHVESGHRHIWCTYCGSQLRITSGSSGHPFAVLDDIRADTALLAKHQALGHLSKYRDELMEERGERHAQREELLPRTVAVPTEGAAEEEGPPGGDALGGGSEPGASVPVRDYDDRLWGARWSHHTDGFPRPRGYGDKQCACR